MTGCRKDKHEKLVDNLSKDEARTIIARPAKLKVILSNYSIGAEAVASSTLEAIPMQAL